MGTFRFTAKGITAFSGFIIIHYFLIPGFLIISNKIYYIFSRNQFAIKMTVLI